jgi:hypothetical protein
MLVANGLDRATVQGITQHQGRGFVILSPLPLHASDLTPDFGPLLGCARRYTRYDYYP